MAILPLAAFEPDKSRYNTAATPEIVNAVPTSDGWGPLQALVRVSAVVDYLRDEAGDIIEDETGDPITVALGGFGIVGDAALSSDATGMFAVRKLDGTEALFAGTVDGLSLFNRYAFTWEDVSHVSGAYTGTGRWSSARFGQVVYAQNGTDPEQKFDVDTDTVFSDNDSAPIAKYIAPVGDFMMRGNLAGYPARVQWSAINNPQSNTATVNLSDYQDMPTGDEVMGIVPLSGGAHIWMRSAVHGMAFALTSEFVFTRQAIDEVTGTSAPYSICAIGQDDYVVYTDSGFVRFKAGGFTNIGEGRVNRWFLANSDQSERSNILAGVDPENNIVWFGYTTKDGERQALGYQYNLNRWCLSTMSMQASTRARTFAYSASSPPIVDDDLSRFALIDDTRQLSYLVGNPLAAVLTTNEYDFARNRSFVNGAHFISDAKDFSVTHMTTDTRGGLFRTRAPVQPSQKSGFIPLRGDGREHKLRVDIYADADWTTATGIDVDVKESGRK